MNQIKLFRYFHVFTSDWNYCIFLWKCNISIFFLTRILNNKNKLIFLKCCAHFWRLWAREIVVKGLRRKDIKPIFSWLKSSLGEETFITQEACLPRSAKQLYYYSSWSSWWRLAFWDDTSHKEARRRGNGETPLLALGYTPLKSECNRDEVAYQPLLAYSVKYTLLSMLSARCSIHLRGKWNYKRIPPPPPPPAVDAADTFHARFTRAHVKPNDHGGVMFARSSTIPRPRLRAKLLHALELNTEPVFLERAMEFDGILENGKREAMYFHDVIDKWIYIWCNISFEF